MKLRKCTVLTILACLAQVSMAGATMIENNTNLSAEWTRMPARVAATDSVDAAIYNPAGTIRLGEGTFIWASNQVLPKDYKHTKGGVEHKTTNLTAVVPGLFAVKNGKRWSGFSGVTVIGGGGTLEYDDGIILDKASGMTVTQIAGYLQTGTPGPVLSEDVTSVWLGGYMGGSFAVNDKLSLALAGRFVYGTNKYEINGGDVLNYEKSGTGFAPIIGLNYTPAPSLNLAFRHEFRTKVEWEVDTMEGSLAPMLAAKLGSESDTSRKDFPAVTALGISWKASNALCLAADVSYAWHGDIDWEGDEEGLDNAIELSFAGEYAIRDTLKVSAGYTYAESGVDTEAFAATLSKNNYHSVAAGFMLEPKPDLKFNVGASVQYKFN